VGTINWELEYWKSQQQVAMAKVSYARLLDELANTQLHAAEVQINKLNEVQNGS
jgi:hypothetical protein